MARLLRYTCHKNLGSGALRRGQHETALAGLLTAAAIDDSDVTLWYKVGVAAYRCGRYHQARSAFKQGLACSPGHWPCMDSLVSVLYLLNDFEECVLRLSAAFRRDPQYTRGRALVDLMLKEQPSLRDTMRPFLPDGDSTLSGREYDPAAGERLTKEAVTLRSQRREQQRRPRPLAPLSLSRPPAAASWEEVGRSLLHLYKHVTDGGAALSLLSPVELEPTLARLQRGEAASPPPPPPPDGEQQETRSGRAAGRHVTFRDEETVRRRLDLDGTGVSFDESWHSAFTATSALRRSTCSDPEEGEIRSDSGSADEDAESPGRCKHPKLMLPRCKYPRLISPKKLMLRKHSRLMLLKNRFPKRIVRKNISLKLMTRKWKNPKLMIQNLKRKPKVSLMKLILKMTPNSHSLESSVYEEENPLPLGVNEGVLSEEKMVERSPGMDAEHTKQQKEEASTAIDQDVDMSVDCADQETSLGEIDDPGSEVKDKEQQDQEPGRKDNATVDKADDKVEENKMDDDDDGTPQSEHREAPDDANLKHQADQDKNGCGDSVEERNPSDESAAEERQPSEEAADKPQTDVKTTISSDKEDGEHRGTSGESGDDCTAAESGDQEKRQVSAESEHRAESEKRADSAEDRRGTSTEEGERDARGSEESSGEERGAESARVDQPDPTDDSCAGAETAGSAQASDTGAESEPAAPAAGRRRGGKRKRNILDSLKMWPRNDPAEKRRSKRSRTAGGLRYEEPAGGDEVANHRETFSALIPAALRYDRSSMKIGEASPRRKAADLAGDGGDQPVPLSEDERDAVLAWVASHAENGGAVRLLWAYLDMLETLRDRRWPSGLAELFTELYELARPHTTRPEPFELEVTADSAPALRRQVLLALLYAELRVDCSLADGAGAEGLQLAEEELSWLGFLVHREDVLEKKQPATLLRFGWCSSKLCRLQGDAPLAMAQLRELEQWYERTPAERRPTVRLANAATERLISQQSVQRQLASLQRVHDLGSLQRLYDQQRLEDVVDVLADTFGGSGSAVKLPQPTAGGEPLPHRSRQLLMMVDALQRLERPRGELAAYAESCLHEALQSYLALDEPAERACWADALLGVLAALQACLERGDDWMETLEPPRRCRLTENLLHLTVHQLNCADAIILPLETVTPWLLLHHAIATAERSASGSGPTGGGRPRTMPAALRFLVEAHEALGARSWCCTDGGALLLRSVDHLLPALDAADDLPYDEQLRRELEQCFFCLYGHPERRRAARDLQDHGVPPVTLTWPRAQLLYYYFCPCELPRFDSYRDLSISADDEALFQRVMALVPEESSPDRLWRALEEFVTASEEQRPPPPAVLPATSVTKNLYYLVADFRFKNRQWETIAPQLESLEFYARDLCINPERRDSWAAMALTRASEVGRELNLCRRPSEDAPELWSRVEAAVRCYQRALELDPSTHDLWLEFGTFSYMLNSHANRLLRQESSGDLDLATFGRLEAIAARMAGQAAECFQRAEEVAVEQAAMEDGEFYDDRWLHHYMLGKIASKDDQPVQRVLAHYQKAQELLRDAECPRKINYQSPPHQALEALEVYYRTHATVLKYLLQHEQQALDGEVRRAIVWHLDAMEQSALPIKPQNEREGELKRKRDPSCSEDPVEVKRLKLDEAAATCAVTLSHKILASAVSEARARLSGLEPPSEQEGLGAASATPAPASTEERAPTVAEGTEQRPSPAAEGAAPVSASTSQSASTPTTVVTASGAAPSAAPAAAASSTAAEAVSDDDVVLLSDDSRPAAPAAPAAKEEEPDPGHRRLVARCVEALHHVIKRFPEHYKSVYRLAHYYYTSKTNRHLDWARDLLLGCADWQTKSHMPTFGLFAERKPNNFFHGIWRIPIEDIDRPGSFAAHMYRSVSLLADVLRAADDFRTLLQLSDWLRPMPDDDKKYLRDAEREQLAGHAFNMGLQCARATFRRLFKAQSPVSGTRRLYFLLGLYETHAGMRPRRRPKIARLLEETYKLFRGGKVESEPPLLQQAISYCRSQVNAIQQAKMQGAPGGPAPMARGSGGVTRGTGRRGRPPLSGSRGRGRPPGSATAVTGGRLPSMQDQLRQLQAAVEAERLRQLQQVWADQLGSRATSVQADVEANYRRLLQLQRAGQPASEQSKPAQTPAKPAQTPAIPAQVTVEPVQTVPKSTAEALTKPPSQTVPQPAVSTATKPATSTSKPPAPAAKQPVSAPAPMPARSAPETTAASRTLAQAASGGADLSVLAALSHAGLTITTVSQESPPPSVTPAQSRPTPPPPQQAAKPRFSDAFRSEEVSQTATVPVPARSQPQTTAAPTRPQPSQPQTTKPQPPQTTKPQPQQTAKPQPQATPKPQPQATSKPQATTKPQSQPTSKPQPQAISKSQSTSKPLPQASAKPRFSDAFRGTENGQPSAAALPALPKSLTVKEVSVPASSASVAASAVASAATGRTSDSVRVSVSPVPPKDGRAAAETLRAVKATPGMTITPTSGGSRTTPPTSETRPSTKDGSISVATVTPTKPSASAAAVSKTPEKAAAPSERLPSEVSVSVSAGGGSVSITPLSTSRPAVTTAAETPSVSLTPAVPRPQPRPVARDRPRPRPTATATALLRQYRSRPPPPPLPRLPSGMTVTPSRAPAPALPSHISITPVSAAPRPAPIPAELARAAAGGLSITPVVPPVRLVSRPRLAAPSGAPRPPPPPRQSSQRPARQPAVRQPVVALQKLPPSVLPSRPAGAPTQRAGNQRPVAGSARPAHSSAGPQRPMAGAARPAHSSSAGWSQRAPPATAAAPARNRPSFSAGLPRQRPAVDMGQLPASISVTPVVVPAQPAKPKQSGGSDDDVICID
ncbi:calcineurin-binding protein cabin-1-like [Amphibalanus amphitrite]|uniref:calcineurin-binding protein cabin-1-like n=1 Tax=Amphibalanus amphitrite TaxID=1232801 RepID=UPI001C92A971|nr:calcineurin-binding protein cabin-1-like [Amphibalanus amphitrite]